MKNKKIYLLLAGLLVLSFFINSCKKEKQTSIPSLFTTGEWQLGSIVRTTYLGDQQLAQDTIPSDSTQIFKFNNDMTCTYTNFDDNVGTIAGKWSLSDTQLYLFSDITYSDTTSAGTKQPFINAHIINLGEFSLVIETGDIQNYYTATDTRIIRRYGFVRIRPVIPK
jgi:hypothetical protein